MLVSNDQAAVEETIRDLLLPKPRLDGGVLLCRRAFYPLFKDFTSTGGRARTDTVLSHHWILSPAERVAGCCSA